MPELAPTVHDPATLVSHGGSPLLVLGSAGTGKTRLILDRFLWLVEQGTLPERIVLLLPSAARADAARAVLETELREGYSELVVVTPPQLAAAVLRRSASAHNLLEATLGAGDRLAMLAERIDELPLQHHDIGGNAGALLGSFVRRIDRLKAELIGAAEFAAWAEQQASPREREFAAIFQTHDRMVGELGACDEGDLVRVAIRLLEDHPSARQPFQQVLIDDAQELDLGAALLARTLAGGALTAAGDPLAAVLRFRGAGAARLDWFETPGTKVVRLLTTYRCPPGVLDAAFAAAGLPISGELGGRSSGAEAHRSSGEVGGRSSGEPASDESTSFWRCENERSQAQAVAAEIERLVSREQVDPGKVAVIVGDIARDGQAVAVALEERAVAHRVVGDAAFFQRAEVRDLLAWLRLLADPGDAPAVVRALARAPIELRSVDIARCTQIARRRKLDMVAALAAATESPQVPPEARERIRVFLKLYRACVAPIDTMRPDRYVHRLIERLGLRRQQLFAAQADVVERLRALARFGELATAHVVRSPQATAREFARSIAAVAEWGLSEREQPQLVGADSVQVVALEMAGGLEVDHVFVLGLRAALQGTGTLDCEPVPDALLHESLPADDDSVRRSRLRQRLYVAITRARERAVLVYAGADATRQSTDGKPLAAIEAARAAVGGEWLELTEDLFGPAETLHSTYRLLRDELMDGTKRAAGRLAELRLDTDLDISHAVVRYLELLKLAALIARDEGSHGQGLSDALRDINVRIEQAVTADQREMFVSSPLDDYLLDAEKDVRHRARVIAARDEPSLERFLPMRGGGVMLSASDIETYRACPLRYKFARVFRIPQEPSLHQRFGIAVHQVLERYHVRGQDGAEASASTGSLTDLLTLLEASWRRGGFGDSDEERQLHQKAVSALTRYHERAQSDQARPVWFERQFSFKLGPHLVRGRVDRVDRLPSGEYELIDYKTGRPKSAEQLANDVQLSLYGIAAREAWGLEANRGAYYYLLDDQKVAISGDDERAEWIRGIALNVAEGIKAQEFEPTPSPRACKLCDYRLVCPAVER
ncbi:MAG TPA: ATP-dependent DNA helicase [Solirubrobacteraceae bacterium]|nr:ATP-dependent DNA helicase [Solirubrobacteraceae bacterium]